MKNFLRTYSSRTLKSYLSLRNPLSRPANALGAEKRLGVIRWIDFALLTICGSVICLLFFPLLDSVSKGLAHYLSEFQPWFTCIVSLVIVVTLGFFLSRLGAKRKRISHVFQMAHPPTWLAGYIGSIVLSTPWIRNSVSLDSSAPAIEGMLAFSFYVVVAIILFVPDEVNAWLEGQTEAALVAPKVSPKENPSILDWVSQERPIDSTQNDLLDHTPIARRAARLLLGEPLPCIGLLGAHGSGKSSIIKMTRKFLSDPAFLKSHSPTLPDGSTFHRHYVLCGIETWGIGENDVARFVLQNIMETLSEHVDTLAIRSVPQHYTKTLAGAGGKWVESLDMLINSPKDPLSTLQKIDSLLMSLRMRLVVFIEDIDRNSDQEVVRAQLLALLDRLKSLRSIAFVLAVGHDVSVTKDLIRVLEHIEPIHPILPQIARRLILSFRSAARIEPSKPWIQVHSDEEYDKFFGISATYDDGLIALAHHDDPNPPIHYLSSLISNPRIAKAIFRRTLGAWQNLRGEVDFDELLAVNTLRSAAPEAYAFVLKHLMRFREAASQNKGGGSQSRYTALKNDGEPTENSADLYSELKSALNRQHEDATSVLGLVEYLFQNSFKAQHRIGRAQVQTVSNEDGPDYWLRIAREELQESDRPFDQDVLREIDAWRQDGVPEPRGDNRLVDCMIDDKLFSAQVVRLGLRINPNDALSLADNLAMRLLDRQVVPCYPKAGKRGFPGLREVCQLSTRKLPVGAQDWLISLLTEVLKSNLRLSNEIYGYWCVDYKDESSSDIDAKKVASTYHEKIRQEFEREPERLAGALKLAYLPHSLHHLVFLFDSSTIVNENAFFSSWSWLGPVLLDTCEKSAEYILPQIAILLSEKSPVVAGEFQSREFVESRASIIFGERLNELLRLFAIDRKFPELDSDIQAYMEAVRRYAQETESTDL